jgi:hypothetical protein
MPIERQGRNSRGKFDKTVTARFDSARTQILASPKFILSDLICRLSAIPSLAASPGQLALNATCHPGPTNDTKLARSPCRLPRGKNPPETLNRRSNWERFLNFLPSVHRRLCARKRVRLFHDRFAPQRLPCPTRKSISQARVVPMDNAV